MQKKILDIIPPEEIKKEEKKTEVKISLPKISIPKISPAAKIKSIWLGAVFFLTLTGTLAYFLLGEAKIKIWPKTEILTFQTIITVNKASQTIDVAQNVIPGVVFQAEKTVSQEFSSSGKAAVEKRAEGVIRIHNNYVSPQTLVQNTRLQAPLDKFQPSLGKGENPWFKTKEKAVIPSKSYQDVKVVADSPGEKYNIKPSKFSVPGLAGTAQYTLIYGESFQEFQGGMKKEVSQVSVEDLEKAKEEVSQKAKDLSLEQIKNQIPAGFVFLPEAGKTEFLENFSLAKPGAELEKFNEQVRAKSSVLSFKKEDLERFAEVFIASKIPEGKKLQENSLGLDYNVYSLAIETGKMALSLNLEIKIYSPIDEISLKKALLGRGLQESRLFLTNQSSVERTQIDLWPFWVKRIPENADKVKTELMFD